MVDSSLELVAELLLDNVSEELLSSYIRLSGILTQVGYDSHHEQLDELYIQYDSGNVDVLTLPTHVDAILLNSLDIVLDQCGLKLSPDLDIDIRIAIAEGILLFDVTDQVEILYDKLQNSVDDAEALCKVLSITTGLEVDTLMPTLDEVSPSLITRLRELIEKGMEVEQPDFNQPSPVSDQISKRFALLSITKPDTIGGELAGVTEPTELSFESLYAYNARVIMKKDVQSAIEDLYSLSALSGLSIEAANREVGMCLDDLYLDPIERAKASRIALSLESEYAPLHAVEVDDE